MTEDLTLDSKPMKKSKEDNCNARMGLSTAGLIQPKTYPPISLKERNVQLHIVIYSQLNKKELNK